MLESIDNVDYVPLLTLSLASQCLNGATANACLWNCRRLLLRKHIHKKTIIHGGKEETLVTETTRVEQDSDPPADLSPSISAVIQQFMTSDKFGSGDGSSGADSGSSRDDGTSPNA